MTRATGKCHTCGRENVELFRCNVCGMDACPRCVITDVMVCSECMRKGLWAEPLEAPK